MKNVFKSCLLLPLLLSGCSSVAETPTQPDTHAATTAQSAPKYQIIYPKQDAEIIYIPGEFNQESLYSLLVAELAGQRRMFPLALEQYLEQAEKTRDPRVAERATRIAQFLNNSKALLQASQLWRDIEPDNTEPYQFEAAVHLHQGEFNQALPLLNKALDQDSSAVLALIRRQSSKLPEVQRQQYLSLLKHRHQENSNDPELLTTLALLYGQAGFALQAESAYNKALALEPDNLDILVQKAELLHKNGETIRSLELVKEAYEKQPDNRQIHLLYVQLLFDSTEYPAAINHAFALRDNNPGDDKLAYYLALLMLENRQMDAAASALNDLLKQSPEDTSPHYYLGYIAQQAQQNTLAMEHFLQVTAGSNLLQSRSRAISLLDQPQDKAQAQSILNQARSDHPDLTTELYMLEAEWLDIHGYRPEGIEILNAALASFPGNLDLLYSRAMLIESVDFLQAEQDLRQILQQEPNNAMTLNALGYTLTLHTQRYEEAYQLISAALRLKPDDPAILDSMGWILFLRGQPDEAVPYLELAYERHPDPEVAAHLIQAYWQTKAKHKARMLLRTALNKSPESPFLLKAQALVNNESTP
ncbi:tetratricopeptide repeat protein [Pontibacter sp. JAM-7]|uniref:tetratricopeptide repeat protein n=1 Tax=Pontibacter sp. JAM-7 TaxID=3366581 RepID=UPI003AF7DDD3